MLAFKGLTLTALKQNLDEIQSELTRIQGTLFPGGRPHR
jgi:hypothetical protein